MTEYRWAVWIWPQPWISQSWGFLSSTCRLSNGAPQSLAPNPILSLHQNQQMACTGTCRLREWPFCFCNLCHCKRSGCPTAGMLQLEPPNGAEAFYLHQYRHTGDFCIARLFNRTPMHCGPLARLIICDVARKARYKFKQGSSRRISEGPQVSHGIPKAWYLAKINRIVSMLEYWRTIAGTIWLWPSQIQQTSSGTCKIQVNRLWITLMFRSAFCDMYVAERL